MAKRRICRRLPWVAVCLSALLAAHLWTGVSLWAAESPPNRPPAIGLSGPVGCQKHPRKLSIIRINTPGVYENFLVDGGWDARQLVEIGCDNVTLRHCEIRNSRNNGIDVGSRNVTIESCLIHHLLKGSFKDQQDAHGITGGPRKLVIRNCEIYQVSGDAVQFDPQRGPWDDVLIDHCVFWTAPLKAPAAGFQAGERPGENAVDTKQLKANTRSRMTIRNSVFFGYGQGQIADQAALNIKENVHVTIENCVVRENDIAFRLRGDTGERGGARVTIRDVAIYTSQTGLRIEDRLKNLSVTNLGFGAGVVQRYQIVKGLGSGYTNVGEFSAPPLEEVLLNGVHGPKSPAAK